ncbi:hypothetical protein M436DRAFT_62561 [Aureobasidium namibiae CBS 147.97]|uniref:Uncharacterized protein n=1 Tax=Aureobasidium namibiae CBS 147.97 TaxID=1043004 RepID=A0A074XKS8_9PEZI
MPAATDPSGAVGFITRVMLFDLMVLARDTSFPDAQIQAICDTVTQENLGDSVELLRRLHASQDTSLVLATTPSPVQSAANSQTKFQSHPFHDSSAGPGAALSSATFYRLCKEDRNKLKYLSKFCPFTLAFRKCPQSDRCQLVHICWERQCKRGRTCMYSHEVSPTCDSIFNGTRCSKTRRLVDDNRKKACPRNHDYNVRLFMGAMRVPHELGFYGIRHIHTPINTTPPAEPDLTSDWMKSDVEDSTSEHDEPGDETMADAEAEEHDEVMPAAEVEKLNIDPSDRPQTPDGDNRSATDLILFT